MKKDIVYIDLDGVIADFDKAIEKLGYDANNFKTEDERKTFVDKLCEKHDRIFLNLEVIEGSQKAIALLAEKYDIYFLSTPMVNVPTSYTDKRLWIEKYFPVVSHKKLILTHNKGLNLGKYLIDDRLVNGVEDFQGEHIHFRSERFPDWMSVLNYLL